VVLGESTEIREFRNTDPRQLVAVWQAHHALSGIHTPLSNTAFESCVASKPYFDPRGLLVAEGEKGLEGFVHVGFGGTFDGSDMSKRRAFLSALCVLPSESADRVAEQLFIAAERYALEQGATDMVAVGEPPDVPFYLGFAPGDGNLGVLAEEKQTQRWLSRFGFIPASQCDGWELVLGQYRQPMDRNQMQIRRQTYVNKMLSEPDLSWWHSCILGQADLLAFQLTLRDENRIHSRVIFWQYDPFLVGSASAPLRLWPMDVPAVEEEREHLLYLLSESLRQLQLERFPAVRYSADASDPNTAGLLQRLGFRLRQNGMRYRKSLVNG
jgi:hypothetical protein